MTTTPNILVHSPDTLTERTPEGVVAHTRNELNKLGNWCSKNTGALAIAVFASCAVNTALAQKGPENSGVEVASAQTSSYDFRPQPTIATLTTTAASPAVSADAASANGYGQTVEFQGEKISVAEVQAKIEKMSPEERTKAIKEGMSRSDRLIFKTWEQQMTKEEVKKIEKDTEVAITTNEEKMRIQELAITTNEEKMRIQEVNIAENQIKLQKKQKVMEEWHVEIIKLLTKIEHNQSLLRNKEVVTSLQTAYDNPDFLKQYPSVIIKIEKYIDKAPKFGG